MTLEEAMEEIFGHGFLFTLRPTKGLEALRVIRKALQEYQDQQQNPTLLRWIPCSERLPDEPGIHVLVTDGIHIMESWYEVIDGEILWVDNYTMYVNIRFGKVTHWMPVPDAPAKEKPPQNAGR